MTATETITRLPSFTCPAVHDKAPGAKHTIDRDVDDYGNDFWTTHCHHCGEIALCGQHAFDHVIDSINGETEFALECQDCGFKLIVTEQEYRVHIAHEATKATEAKGAPEPRVTVDNLSDLGERPFKLYKILITEIPAACDSLRLVWDDEVQAFVRSRDWKPAGWTEYVHERILDGANWSEDQHFFWPSEEKTYRSRSAAASKAAIVERWGGKAIILEAEVSAFIPSEQAKAQRAYERKMAQVNKADAKAEALMNEARILKMKSGLITDVAF